MSMNPAILFSLDRPWLISFSLDVIATRNMKKKLTFLLAFALIGCASIDSKVARLSTSELELRRQQIAYRLAQTSGQWSTTDWGLGSHDVIGDRNDLLKEKEAIERELLRRRQTGQR